jgi:hypothetical protein
LSRREGTRRSFGVQLLFLMTNFIFWYQAPTQKIQTWSSFTQHTSLHPCTIYLYEKNSLITHGVCMLRYEFNIKFYYQFLFKFLRPSTFAWFFAATMHALSIEKSIKFYVEIPEHHWVDRTFSILPPSSLFLYLPWNLYFFLHFLFPLSILLCYSEESIKYGYITKDTKWKIKNRKLR